MNMKRCKKKIWKVLLMISVIVLFNCMPVVASELDTLEATTEATTEAKVATSSDAWYTMFVGSPDQTPKTLDDIYVLLYWILIFQVIFIICVAFIFIYNCLM